MKKLILISLLTLLPALAHAETHLQLSDNVPSMTGNDEYTAFEISLQNGSHTGAGNKLTGIKFPDMILDNDALGTAIDLGQGWHYGLHLATNLPILFGPVQGGTQVYFDGSILSISNDLIIYGDLAVNDNAIKDFDVLAIKHEDLSGGACQQDRIRIDNGGPTLELCYCEGIWMCVPLRRGPID